MAIPEARTGRRRPRLLIKPRIMASAAATKGNQGAA